MNYELLKQVVENLERFEQENEPQNSSLKDFGFWLLEQQNTGYQSKNSVLTNSENFSEEFTKAGETTEVVIGQLLTFLSRYLKIYLKKGLQDSILTTGDDFTYLATLWNKKSLTKTELILLSAHEKTSGMEVIKRLLANELIQQTDDEIDKRSKRIMITQKGLDVLMQSFESMDKVGKICVGDLTNQEQNQLAYLLKKLDNFHNDIYLNHREKDLDEILGL